MLERLALLAVCLTFAAPASAATPAEQLQQMLDRFVAEHPLNPGASVYVSVPSRNIEFNGAAGKFALGSLRPLDPDDPYRHASITKTWTAATILRLVEQRRLRLSDTIDRYLPADLVARLHVGEDGVSRGHLVTVRQLLNHTSGINNYSTDERWLAEVGTGPRRHWTAEELIEWAITHGPPDFAPGEGWTYNDTGYNLLVLVIRRVTGLQHWEAYRRLLPMRRQPDTYLEKLEPAPAGARERAHQYFGPYDLHGHDPTYDTWGGGGLVTTGRDQARFVRDLFEGRVYRRRATLRTMLRTVRGELVLPGDTESKPVVYGLGIARASYGGVVCWQHTGAYGNFMAYCPRLRLAVGGTTNQFVDEVENSADLMKQIVGVAERAR